MGSPNVYGGQILAQALDAATLTVPEDRVAHSFHGYFILPGDINKPIIFEVDRIRDGGSFTTRRVVAIQNGEAIFNSSCSFQLKQEGFDHQIDMPDVPMPDELKDSAQLAKKYSSDWPDFFKQFFKMPRPIEFRPTVEYDYFNPGEREPFRKVWFKAKGTLPDDPQTHRKVLAYASDYNLLTTAILPHFGEVEYWQLQLASLDHAMWFHRDFRADEWLLYSIDSPSASNARGFTRGNVFNQQGELVASVVQEGMIRKRRGV